MVLIVGLPGAGKTTQAKELAARHHAIRLTPDEWMVPLFGLCWREPLARGKRDVLEGRREARRATYVPWRMENYGHRQSLKGTRNSL